MAACPAGTLFGDNRPRIVSIKGINMEAEIGPHMLYVTNQDKPGFIGALGSVLGDAGVNIATFHLGRHKQEGEAIALIEIDSELSLRNQESCARPLSPREDLREPPRLSRVGGFCEQWLSAGKAPPD